MPLDLIQNIVLIGFALVIGFVYLTAKVWESIAHDLDKNTPSFDNN